MRLERGTVALVQLDPTEGHEQSGIRPCIVVSDPDVTADQRFPLVCVVPVTGVPGKGALYPTLAPGGSGLSKQSYALVDHVRSVDKRRMRRVYGKVHDAEMGAIDEGLMLFLGIGS
jgi:mRNA interferase MazF